MYQANPFRARASRIILLENSSCTVNSAFLADFFGFLLWLIAEG
jgi:hypothetical protein